MAEPERVADAAEEVEDMEEEEDHAGMDAFEQVLKRPDVLAALQGRLHAEMLERYIVCNSRLFHALNPGGRNLAAIKQDNQQLPANVKRRIKSLKKLQLEATNIEAKFYEEVHLLECKYHKLFTPLYEKRGEIISGQYEPTDVECEWESDDEKEPDLTNDMKNILKIEDVDVNKKPETEVEKTVEETGIPGFWLTIFKNVQLLADMLQEHDEPILKHLSDIKVIFLESDPMGFVLEFHFAPNEYFSNSVLTKEYEMKCTPEESDPFSFEGPEIYKCKGCIIDWKKGKNVTVKTIKKKQKHKSKGSVRTVTKTVQNDSFFNFFTPPCMPDDPEAEMDEETQSLLTSDFEIGHYIRERIVPRAVLYYTGEALEDEDYEEEDEGEGEEEEEEDDDDDDPEFNSSNKHATAPKNGNPNDCKQQ